MESSGKPRWRQWGLMLLLAASFFLAVLFGVMVQEEEEDRNTIPKIGYVIGGDVQRLDFNSVHYEGMKKACE